MSRPGLALWGSVGRWVFLNWPRGSWQYDLICAAVIAGLFIFPGPEQSGEPLGVDAVLSEIERADATLESFTATIVTTEYFVLFDERSVERGTMAFLKPNSVRREIEEPALRTEVLAEGLAQVYIPRINQVEQFPVESSEQGQQLVVPGLASASELRVAYEVSLLEVADQIEQESGEDTQSAGPGSPGETAGGAVAVAAATQEAGRFYVLRLVPRLETEAAKHWKSIVLWVPEGQWHPARRIVMQQHNDDTNTIDLLGVVRNPGLEPEDFELDLPADVEIIRHAAN